MADIDFAIPECNHLVVPVEQVRNYIGLEDIEGIVADALAKATICADCERPLASDGTCAVCTCVVCGAQKTSFDHRYNRLRIRYGAQFTDPCERCQEKGHGRA